MDRQDDMTDGTSTSVVLTGGRELLGAGVGALITAAIESDELRDAALHPKTPKDKAQLRTCVSELRLEQQAVVVLLLDPAGQGWLDAADELRADDRVAFLPLVARPNYAIQRVWRRKIPSGNRCRASGILALNSPAKHLTLAIAAAAATPHETGFWLSRDGDDAPVSRHPADFLAHEAPDDVRDILKNAGLHETLVLASRLSTKEAAARVGIEPGSFRDRVKGLRRRLDAPSDVALGRMAASYGLFEDTPPEWWRDSR